MHSDAFLPSILQKKAKENFCKEKSVDLFSAPRFINQSISQSITVP